MLVHANVLSFKVSVVNITGEHQHRAPAHDLAALHGDDIVAHGGRNMLTILHVKYTLGVPHARISAAAGQCIVSHLVHLYTLHTCPCTGASELCIHDLGGQEGLQIDDRHQSMGSILRCDCYVFTDCENITSRTGLILQSYEP